MKLKTMMGVWGLATALCVSAGNLLAQNNPGGGAGGGGGFGGGGGPGGGGGFGGGGPGGGGGFGGGGPGGGGGFGGGAGGAGGFDPAQIQQTMQQRQLDNDRQTLVITNDDEWAVIQPLIQKVMDAQQALGTTGGGMNMRGGGGRGGRGGAGGFGGFGGAQASDEEVALQQAIDNNAPSAQIREALASYRAARKAKQGALETAQANLKKVLTTKQEAQAVLLGLLT